MAGEAAPVRPIYVIKKKGGHGGHHGGAWKVAYADFVTAMMSLFIVLWLLNSTPQIKQAVAGYFNDPKSSGKETGSRTLASGESVSIDKTNVEKLKDEIEKAILKQKDLQELSKQVEITVTNEGLKIELIEDKGGTFFESGNPMLSGNGTKLLQLLSEQLKPLPNRLSIEGHTDAQPFAGENGYTNWELSADRANSARRLLQQDGLEGRISQVRGFADQMPRVPGNPMDPSNRRISIIVQWLDPAAPAPAVPDADSKKAPADEVAANAKPEELPAKAKPEEAAGKAKAEEGAGKKPEAGKPADRSSAAVSSPAPAATPAPVAAAAKGSAPASAPLLAENAAPAKAKPGMMERIKGLMPHKKK